MQVNNIALLPRFIDVNLLAHSETHRPGSSSRSLSFRGFKSAAKRTLPTSHLTLNLHRTFFKLQWKISAQQTNFYNGLLLNCHSVWEMKVGRESIDRRQCEENCKNIIEHFSQRAVAVERHDIAVVKEH